MSDDEPFLEKGITCVRGLADRNGCEVAWNHSTSDTIGPKCDMAFMAKVAQVNVAALAVLASPLQVPVLGDSKGPAQTIAAGITNSANGILRITVPASFRSSPFLVRILDMRGHVVERRAIYPDAPASSVSHRDLGSGSYVIVVSSPEGTMVRKFVAGRQW